MIRKKRSRLLSLLLTLCLMVTMIPIKVLAEADGDDSPSDNQLSIFWDDYTPENGTSAIVKYKIGEGNEEVAQNGPWIDISENEDVTFIYTPGIDAGGNSDEFWGIQIYFGEDAPINVEKSGMSETNGTYTYVVNRQGNSAPLGIRAFRFDPDSGTDENELIIDSDTDDLNGEYEIVTIRDGVNATVQENNNFSVRGNLTIEGNGRLLGNSGSRLFLAKHSDGNVTNIEGINLYQNIDGTLIEIANWNDFMGGFESPADGEINWIEFIYEDGKWVFNDDGSSADDSNILIVSDGDITIGLEEEDYERVTIENGRTLTIPEGKRLIIRQNLKLETGATLNGNGDLQIDGQQISLDGITLYSTYVSDEDYTIWQRAEDDTTQWFNFRYNDDGKWVLVDGTENPGNDPTPGDDPTPTPGAEPTTHDGYDEGIEVSSTVTVNGQADFYINNSTMVNLTDDTQNVVYKYDNVNNTVDFYFDCFITNRITSLTINGIDYYSQLPDPTTEDGKTELLNACKGQLNEFKIEVPHSNDYTVEISTKELDDTDYNDYMVVGNFLWTYTDNNQVDDYLDHGTMELVNVRYGDNEYSKENLENPGTGFDWEENQTGYSSAVLPVGAVVTVKLIPDYGYQLTSFGINGGNFATEDAQSTFTFAIKPGNAHLGAHFTPVDDKVTSTAQTVTDGNIVLGNSELTGGSAQLKISDATLNANKQEDFSDATPTGYTVANYLNLDLYNIYYKGTTDTTNVWETEIENLAEEATITVSLDDSVLSSVADSNDLVIVHNIHNGDDFETIAIDSYDPDTNTISFKTRSFSTYAIANKNNAISNEHTHAIEKIEAKAATCTVEGNNEYYHCTGCDKYFKDSAGATETSVVAEKISKLAHTWEVKIDTPATENATGVSHEECSVCHEKRNEGTIIPKLDHTHNLVKVDAVVATCTKEGNNEYYHCTKCDQYFKDATGSIPTSVEAEKTAKIAHTPSAAVKENEVAATCTAAGSYDEVVYCSVCHTEISRTAKTVEKLAHSYEWKTVTEPTKESEGLAEEVCSVCGNKSGNTKTIDKLPADPEPVKYTITEGAAQTVEQGKEATFRSDADYAKFVKVTVDGKDVDAANYTVKEGSTVVTFKSDYTKTLTVGTHTLAVVSNDGTATTTFEIKAATDDSKKPTDTTSPKTGDQSPLALWIALLFISGGALSVIVVTSRKRKIEE